MKRSLLLPAFSVVLVSALSSLGSGVSTLGFESAESLGMGGAGSAVRGRLGNASVNPAALAGATNVSLSVGASALWVNGKYIDGRPAFDGKIKEQILPLPHGQLVVPLNAKFTLGLGVAAPEAHSVTWDWNDNAAGDALMEESTLAIAAITPSLALRADERLSIALAPQLFYCVTHEVDALTRDSRGRRDWHSTDADGYGRGVGVLLGVNYAPSTEWTVAAKLATGANLDMNYDSTGVSGAASGTVLDDLRTPQQLGVGVATTAVDKWLFAADLLFSSWNRFDGEAGSRYEDDTLALGVGAEYQLTAQWTLRAGYLFDEGKSYGPAMVPTAPLGEQHILSAGVGYTPDGTRGVDLALAQSRGQEQDSEIAGLPGRFEDFQRWTAAATGWWRF